MFLNPKLVVLLLVAASCVCGLTTDYYATSSSETEDDFLAYGETTEMYATAFQSYAYNSDTVSNRQDFTPTNSHDTSETTADVSEAVTTATDGIESTILSETTFGIYSEITTESKVETTETEIETTQSDIVTTQNPVIEATTVAMDGMSTTTDNVNDTKQSTSYNYEQTTPESEEDITGSETTEPEIETTQPDIGSTQPDIASTQPDIGSTQSDIETTQPDKETTHPEIETTQSNIDTTQSDIETSQPASQSEIVPTHQPGMEPTQQPEIETTMSNQNDFLTELYGTTESSMIRLSTSPNETNETHYTTEINYLTTGDSYETITTVILSEATTLSDSAANMSTVAMDGMPTTIGNVNDTEQSTYGSFEQTTPKSEVDITESKTMTTSESTNSTTSSSVGSSTTTIAITDSRLLPYGSIRGDTEAFADEHCVGCRSSYWWYRNFYATEIFLGHGLPLLTNNRCRRKTCYMGISSTGYVTFREKSSANVRDMYVRRWPTEWNWAFDYWRRDSMLHSGLYMFAPFWSDTNYIYDSESKVYYHIYKKKRRNDEMSEEIFSLCDGKVWRYSGEEEFETTLAVVVTWEKLMPPQHWWCRYEYYCYNSYGYNWWCRYYDFTYCHTLSIEQNTFQLVIASNPKKGLTYALYLYGDMTWTYPRRVHVGYYMQSRNLRFFDQHTETFFTNIYWPYNKRTPYEIDTTPNPLLNREKGVLFYTISSGDSEPNYDELCVNWYDEEKEQTPIPYYGTRWGFSTPEYLSYIRRWNWWWRTSACPCDIGQAQDDWRFEYNFVLSNRSERRDCYTQRWSWWYTVSACCYKLNTGALITKTKMRNYGHTYLFHPTWYWTKAFYRNHDDMPKKYCCRRSDNCDKFFELRPTDDCSAYVAPRFTWFSGDPHITTIDGHSYTFNGLGEYVLIKTTEGNFTLQGRTLEALDENGKKKPATVFSAIVGSDTGGDTMQVELNSTRDGLLVYMIDTDITDTWFLTADVDDSNNDYESITLTKVSNQSVRASFGSGFAVTVTYGEGQLSITTAASINFLDETAGLLGVYNDDASDDYTKRDGSTLSISAPESQVYSEFGEDWRTTREESIFIYHEGETFESFTASNYTPMFLDVLQQNYTDTEWQAINDTCEGNIECMFDYAVTGNEAFAHLTLSTTNSNQNMSDAMANARPVLSVNPTQLNLAIDEEGSVQVQASDNDIDDTTTLYMEFTNTTNDEDISSQASFVAGVFTWTPLSTSPVELLFYATDSKGALSAEVVVTVRLCECSSGRGVCDYNTPRNTQDPSASFILVECQCNSGWSGIDCSTDIDGCIDNNCGCNETEDCTGSNTRCFDLHPDNDTSTPGGAYICGPCNDGYEKRNGDPDNDCINIDECMNQTDNNCNKTHGFCLDTEGSFKCGCNSGYRLNANLFDCNDVDECIEGTATCEHACENTDGSFMCTCESGYSLNSDSVTCTLEPTFSERCTASGCEYCGVNSPSNVVYCFCPHGYSLHIDGVTCTDRDECTEGNSVCDEHSECVNTPGSYQCNCTTGYILNDDQRSCSACEEGYWGDECAKLCRCQIGTDCDPTTGCSNCSDSGLTGGNCDEDLNECMSDPCGDNTDECINTFGSYRCPCLTGFQRLNFTTCTDIDDCESMPCQNGAECVNNPYGVGYSCACVNGFTGNDCETDIDECSSNPCLNEGTCQDMIGKYRCQCLPNFYGTNCDVMRYEVIIESVKPDSSESRGLPTAAKISIGVAAALVGVVVILIIALSVYKAKTSKGKAELFKEEEREIHDESASQASDSKSQPKQLQTTSLRQSSQSSNFTSPFDISIDDDIWDSEGNFKTSKTITAVDF